MCPRPTGRVVAGRSRPTGACYLRESRDMAWSASPVRPGDTEPLWLTSDPVCTGGPQGWDPHRFGPEQRRVTGINPSTRLHGSRPTGVNPVRPARNTIQCPGTEKGVGPVLADACRRRLQYEEGECDEKGRRTAAATSCDFVPHEDDRGSLGSASLDVSGDGDGCRAGGGRPVIPGVARVVGPGGSRAPWPSGWRRITLATRRGGAATPRCVRSPVWRRSPS
jgi:hypothetical protein